MLDLLYFLDLLFWFGHGTKMYWQQSSLLLIIYCFQYKCINKNDVNKKSQFIYSKRGPDREHYYDVMTSATTGGNNAVIKQRISILSPSLIIHHLKQSIKRKVMKLQELTSKTGVNVKNVWNCKNNISTCIHITIFQILSLSCFPLYRYAARPITEPYCKNQYKSIYRYIDTALVYMI